MHSDPRPRRRWLLWVAPFVLGLGVLVLSLDRATPRASPEVLELARPSVSAERFLDLYPSSPYARRVGTWR